MHGVAVAQSRLDGELIESIERWWRVLRRVRWVVLALLAVGTALLIALLLPTSLPGELDSGRLLPGRAACPGCRDSQRLEGAGIQRQGGFYYVTATFSAPPTAFLVSLQGHAVPIAAGSRGGRWTVSGGVGSDLSLKGLVLESSGSTVVIGLPATFATTGVAVSTQSDRAPQIGYAPLRQTTNGFNPVDLVALLLIAYAAYAGWRRGFLAAGGRLLALVAVVVGTLVLLPLLEPPLRSAFSSRVVADAVAYIVVLTAMSVLAVLLARAWGTALRSRVGAAFGEAGEPIDRYLGVAAEVIRIAILLAIALSVISTLSSLSWLGQSVQSSVLGSALAQAWTALRPA